jgi:hypothetical protein
MEKNWWILFVGILIVIILFLLVNIFSPCYDCGTPSPLIPRQYYENPNYCEEYSDCVFGWLEEKEPCRCANIYSFSQSSIEWCGANVFDATCSCNTIIKECEREDIPH